ncbi:4'-phosphopantetheinyl transferase superfamily protein [Streptomyces sp. CB01881]|uniref:4'-phosphopantetheinyl transferase family protein n=1 Tax=Streptomyces sp. CB01881 TaxID=2078691 RepID=UPI000CDC9E1A|nr:4'-phosphopantetheinyl transferase superfamily protein [Streptomyces sp. CB01881]AUY52829.1 4'-phosphopantetheinyl transferase [Streptomyces sp. CB01881]TYC70548.1 4'-phosphopantetheinyl transferase superfamily protein [Streptomyces sp. CB01881]
MIGELLPGSVVAEVAYDDPPQARLEPAEEAAIARAVGSRRREFTTVRHCARLALGRLGVPYLPLVPGLRGAPGWPDGVVGSLTHCAGFRGAAVAHAGDVVSLGIDAEPALPLPEGVFEAIALPDEQKRTAELLAEHPDTPWDRLLFSAKESVYKTWFPLTRLFLEFSEADLTFRTDGTFHAELLVPGPVVDGRRLGSFDGRWTVRDGLLATAITVLP